MCPSTFNTYESYLQETNCRQILAFWFSVGCIRVFHEEYREVDLSVELMLRFAVELIFCIICIIFLLPDIEYMFTNEY